MIIRFNIKLPRKKKKVWKKRAFEYARQIDRLTSGGILYSQIGCMGIDFATKTWNLKAD